MTRNHSWLMQTVNSKRNWPPVKPFCSHTQSNY